MRIKGTLLDNQKTIRAGLTQIYGVGRSSAAKILKTAKINPDTRVGEITADQRDLIRGLIDKLEQKIEGDLRLEISRNIRRLKDIGSYRGDRHSRNLPLRGQRTKTNARTKRGKRVTIGSGRKKGLEKT